MKTYKVYTNFETELLKQNSGKYAEMISNYPNVDDFAEIKFDGKTYIGTMFGSDECFDLNGFYQYFAEDETLYKCYFNFHDEDGNEYEDLGDVDYKHPVEMIEEKD